MPLDFRGELNKIVRVNDEFRLHSIKFILIPQNNAIHHPKIPTALDSASNGNHISNNNGDYAALDSRFFTQIETPVDYMSLICSSERSLKDREGLLECKGRNFYAVLTSTKKREEERQRIESQQRKDGLVVKSRLMGFDERGLTGFGDELGKVGENVPIILVPSAFQTLITIYNVKEFLEDGVYIPTDVKVKQMNGEDGEDENGVGSGLGGSGFESGEDGERGEERGKGRKVLVISIIIIVVDDRGSKKLAVYKFSDEVKEKKPNLQRRRKKEDPVSLGLERILSR
ncbi:hypothetical protein ACFX2I_026622 [Malus domestica]